MPISLLFMFAYQIRNPVYCWSPSPFHVGVPTISSFICGSPRHIHFFFFCGSPRHSFLFLLRESPPILSFSCGSPRPFFSFSYRSPRLISFSIAGVPASYRFQLQESPPYINFNCGSPRLISISIAGVHAHLGLNSFQFHQFHPNLISKDEENSWPFTVIHNFTFHHNFI